MTLLAQLLVRLLKRRLFHCKVKYAGCLLQLGIVLADFTGYLVWIVIHAVMKDSPQFPVRVEAREVTYSGYIRVAEIG